MKPDTLLSTEESINAALQYLASKEALDTLADEVPVVGRSLCLWLPEHKSSLKGDKLRVKTP
jgi:hypothetical protein